MENQNEAVNQTAEQVAADQAAADKAAADKAAAAQAKAAAKAQKDAEKAAAAAAKAEAKKKADEARAAEKAKKEEEAAAAKRAKEEAAAKKAAEKAAAAQAAAEAKNKVTMPSQNGVTRPRPEGACGKVWALADSESARLGQPVPIANLMIVTKANGLNDATTRTQYARWKTFNGVFGPVSKIVETPAAAAGADQTASNETAAV